MILRFTGSKVEYSNAMLQLQDYIKEQKIVIWFLEHEPVITSGMTSSLTNDITNHLNNVQIIKTNRGGADVYHGPGQRVIYFSCPVSFLSKNNDIKEVVSALEMSVVRACYALNIMATARIDGPGIWLSQNFDGKLHQLKVGFIGLHVNRDKWISHGIAINICTDLSLCSCIEVCGKKRMVGNIKVDMRKFDHAILQELSLICDLNALKIIYD